MLKIVLIELESDIPTLRLEGRVIGPWVEELRRSCEKALARSARLSLDLSEVSFVDRDGVELFRSLPTRRVAFLNCTGFVAELLRAEVGHGDAAGGA